MTKNWTRYEIGDYVEVNLAHSVGIDREPPRWQPGRIVENIRDHPTFGGRWPGYLCEVPARNPSRVVVRPENIRYMRDLAPVGLGLNALVRVTRPVAGYKDLAGTGPWRVSEGGYEGKGGKRYLRLRWAGEGRPPGSTEWLTCKASIVERWDPKAYEPFALQVTIVGEDGEGNPYAETFNFLETVEANGDDEYTLKVLARAAEAAAAAYAGGLDREEVRTNAQRITLDGGCAGRKEIHCW